VNAAGLTLADSIADVFGDFIGDFVHDRGLAFGWDGNVFEYPFVFGEFDVRATDGTQGDDVSTS
jgi:hypothetical protein